MPYLAEDEVSYRKLQRLRVPTPYWKQRVRENRGWKWESLKHLGSNNVVLTAIGTIRSFAASIPAKAAKNVNP